jgi:hypothetical protein
MAGVPCEIRFDELEHFVDVHKRNGLLLEDKKTVVVRRGEKILEKPRTESEMDRVLRFNIQTISHASELRLMSDMNGKFYFIDWTHPLAKPIERYVYSHFSLLTKQMYFPESVQIFLSENRDFDFWRRILGNYTCQIEWLLPIDSTLAPPDNFRNHFILGRMEYEKFTLPFTLGKYVNLEKRERVFLVLHYDALSAWKRVKFRQNLKEIEETIQLSGGEKVDLYIPGDFRND